MPSILFGHGTRHFLVSLPVQVKPRRTAPPVSQFASIGAPFPHERRLERRPSNTPQSLPSGATALQAWHCEIQATLVSQPAPASAARRALALRHLVPLHNAVHCQRQPAGGARGSACQGRYSNRGDSSSSGSSSSSRAGGERISSSRCHCCLGRWRSRSRNSIIIISSISSSSISSSVIIIIIIISSSSSSGSSSSSSSRREWRGDRPGSGGVPARGQARRATRRHTGARLP